MPAGETGQEMALTGLEAMSFDELIVAAALLATARRCGWRSSSKCCFRTSTGRSRSSAWDDGIARLRGRGVGPGRKLLDLDLPGWHGAAAVLFDRWEFGEGDTADLEVQIDRRAPWNLTGAELYQNSVLFYLPDSDAGGRFHRRGRAGQPALPAVDDDGSDVQNYSLAGSRPRSTR